MYFLSILFLAQLPVKKPLSMQVLSASRISTATEFPIELLKNLSRNYILGNKASVTMASSDVKPKSISHAKKWSEEIENLYRFQQAGYRDETEYKQVKQVSVVDRWPETGYVKKLQRRDNTFYYYNKQRECDDKEVHKVKIYTY
ncbi:PREDICTED: meiosis expressed gene 1 protein homolog isoform X1 [Cercocebus atys]|nr:PREDICTED: meiosis expressed gene 1 protein homolog isoform X1 [Cercocebus atys]